MLFAPIVIVSTLTLLANTQSTTTDAAIASLTPSAVLPAFVPAAVPTATLPAALQKYLASITEQPEYISANLAFSSVMPASVLNQMETDTAPLGWWPMAGEAPSWVSAMPTSYVSIISSIRVAECSILSRAAEGPAPTNAPRVKVVGAALVVGAAGLALL